ncbi:unnamed protein product, partial [Rotaria sordida]
MYTNNSLTHTTTSIPSLSFNSSSTPSQHLYPTPQRQTPTPSCASLSSEIRNTAPSFQQDYQHLCSHQFQSQILTQDEWNLILTVRMMKTLNVLPSFQPPSSSLYQHSGDLTSYQSTSSNCQIGHQLSAPTFYTTAAGTLPTSPYYNEASSIHPYAAPTTASSIPPLLATAISSTAPLITAASSLASYAIVTSSLPRDTTAYSSSPLITTASSSLASYATTTSSLPPYTTASSLSSPYATTTSWLPPYTTVSSSSTPYATTTSSLPPYTTASSLSSSYATTSSLSSPYTTASSSPPPSTILILQELEQTLLPRIQQAHQNDSSISQLQLHSPTSPPVILMSPIQQQQQKSPNQYSSAAPQQTQSVYSHASATYQYDSSMSGPTIQLLDPTKPYRIGDTIKVAGRTLQSDTVSMKYWLEDDITITETTNGGHILNMAGYSYFRKIFGKNFTTWECEYRRRKHCSSIVIRSSNPTIKNYFRIYSIQGEHIHHPTPENIEIRLFKQRVRDRCRQELSCPRTIYEHELQKGKYSGEMLALLPTFYNMQAQLYRIRQEHLPTSPTDPNFQSHPGFTTTDQGKRFLLYDSNASQAPYVSAPSEVGRLLIYSSDLQLVILSKSKRIGSDGTFETAAQISHQYYIIMGEYEEKHP